MGTLPDFDALQSKFKEMEEKGEVNYSIIEDLEELKEKIYEEDWEKYISEQEKMNKFKTYFAIRTQIDILNSMKKRIEEGNKNDNPRVAEESLEILDIMNKFSNMSPSNISDFTFSEVLELQRKAKRLGLFPDSKEMKKNIDLEKIEEENSLFTNLRKRFSSLQD